MRASHTYHTGPLSQRRRLRRLQIVPACPEQLVIRSSQYIPQVVLHLAHTALSKLDAGLLELPEHVREAAQHRRPGRAVAAARAQRVRRRGRRARRGAAR